jgi:16S rRNA (guanine966-N2)-methyltransferase
MSAMGGHFAGWVILDLFAGSGALGLECLSRGAAHVTFVDQAHSSLSVLRRNLTLVGAAGERATVIQAEVFSWLEQSSREPEASPDAALADPPYGHGLAGRLVERFVDDPFAKALWVEHATGEAIPEAPGSRQRRYGDSTLTYIPATP